MGFTATPVDGSGTPIPMSSAVPDGTNTPLPIEGGPAVSTGGNTLVPVSMYVKDGNDLTQGVTTDAAVTGDNAGTLSAKLRGLSKIFFDMWDSTNHWLQVKVMNATALGQATSANSSPVVIASDQLPIPTGLYRADGPPDVTGKSQGSGYGQLHSIQGKLLAGATGNITTTVAGDANLAFASAPKTLVAGQPIQLSIGAASPVETVYVSSGYTPSSSATVIPLQFPVVFSSSTTAKYDIFAPLGPSASLMLPTGMFPMPLAALDGAGSGGYYMIKSASADLQAVNNMLGLVPSALTATSTADRQRAPNIFKPFNAQALTATSGNTPVSIWTPAAGKKFRLMGYWFSVTTAAGIVFHDLASVGGGGVIPVPSPIAAAAGIVQSPPIGNGFISAAANNQLWIDSTIASNVTGFVWGMEE